MSRLQIEYSQSATRRVRGIFKTHERYLGLRIERRSILIDWYVRVPTP
jgi:hypothetical protein